MLIVSERIIAGDCVLRKEKWVGINSGPEDQGPGTRVPNGNNKSQNTDSFITTLHYRRLCCIVVQVSNTIFLS